MIVLDTNVISEIVKPTVDPNVKRWFQSQPITDLYLCDVVLMEQAYGGERFWLKNGSRRYLRVLEGVLERYDGRILALTKDAAMTCGKLRARRENIGRPLGVQDAIIAATCLAHGATLATRNRKDFAGLDLLLVNPFEDQ